MDIATIPIAPAACELAGSHADRQTALEHALGDGEDFELILAVPPQDAQRMLSDRLLECPLTRIGRFTADPGCWQIDERGTRTPLISRGYEHRLGP